MLHQTYRTAGTPALRLSQVYLLAAGIQGLLAAGAVLSLGSLSPFRTVLLAGFIALFLTCAALLAAVSHAEVFASGWSKLAARLDQRKVWSGLLITCGLAFASSAAFLTMLPDLSADAVGAVAARLAPLAAVTFGMSAQTAAALLILRHGSLAKSLRPQSRIVYITLLLLITLLVVWIGWAARVVLPTESQRLGWNPMGVPLLGTQIFAAWAAVLILMLLFVKAGGQESLPRPGLWNRIDWLLSLLIWLAALIAWQSAPLVSSWFLTEPVAPNFEYYPNSDARAYDTSAQTALIGEGYTFYGAPFVRRSLLAMIITGLHMLGGQDYARVIFFQIMLLALFPVALFWVARLLHNRFSGFLIAILVILREVNSIHAAGDITTSHVKLLMADLPTALLVALFLLLSTAWLKHLHTRLAPAAAVGAALGLSMLVRPETGVFILPQMLVAALILWPGKHRKLWLKHGLLAALGTILVLSPWILRNYLLTGLVFLDSPYFQTSLILQRFHPSREIDSQDLDSEGLPDEPSTTPIQTPASIPTSVPLSANVTPGSASTLTPQPAISNPPAGSVEIIDFFFQNAGRLSKVMLGHTLHSQVQNLLILPSSPRWIESTLDFVAHRSTETWLEDCCTLRSYIRALPFWRSWDGSFPTRTLIPLALNLFLIAYGVSESWKRHHWAGIALLLSGMSYIFFNGIFRNSGGRYILPVDWISLIYFSIGLAQITQNSLVYLFEIHVPEELHTEASPTPSVSERLTRRKIAVSLTVGMFLIGALIPLSERAFPQQYTEGAIQAKLTKLLESEQLTQNERIILHTYLNNGASTQGGLGLYPRFFPANAGDDVAKRHPFAARPYPRVGFYLAGAESQVMSLPVEARPQNFPNAVDVLVIVCPPRDILALALFSKDGALDQVYLRSSIPDQAVCPLPAETFEPEQ